MNLLKALLYLSKNCQENPTYRLGEFYRGKNRANNMGEALEEFVKDLFSGCLNCSDTEKAKERHSNVFSYLGNQNNPPDCMLRGGGDAIEVKKIGSRGAVIALNSSYPKAQLLADSPMIINDCRECEPWKKRDIIYAIGVVKNSILNSLSFVYGEDYAAKAEIYERIKVKIKSGILTIPDVEFSETKELGRVNGVDPLNRTYLRIRGMWHIINPNKAFNWINSTLSKEKFSFFAVINESKYETFPIDDRNAIEDAADNSEYLNIKNKKIENPNTGICNKIAKVIEFSI